MRSERRLKMNILKKIKNYLCYCGIEKEEYNKVKKGAYASNFEVWRILHILLSVAFACLFVYSLFFDLMKSNTVFYLIALIYSVAATIAFFVLKKDSLIAQLAIYLSISLLFLFGCLITQNKPNAPATMFIVLLLITPMFMIDRPYYMGLLLVIASTIFSVWMYHVKPYSVWIMDFINIIIYTIIGFFIHIIANSIRIKEFVLTRKINIQKDTDELSGLKNKAALTREINEFLSDESKNKGIMLMLDINNFKTVNDTYVHDIGDVVINQLGTFLTSIFKDNEIIGRFGGDEFIVFIKNTDDLDYAAEVARKILDGVSEKLVIPNTDLTVGVSIGIAIYHGEEKNYSEIFKKADIALYKTKADRTTGFNICQ